MGKYPNDVHFPMSQDQVNETVDKAFELEAAGQVEESERLLNSIPVSPCAARIMKRDLGLDFLAENKVNLWDAIQAYGEGFVEQ